MVVTIYEPED